MDSAASSASRRRASASSQSAHIVVARSRSSTSATRPSSRSRACSGRPAASSAKAIAIIRYGTAMPAPSLRVRSSRGGRYSSGRSGSPCQTSTSPMNDVRHRLKDRLPGGRHRRSQPLERLARLGEATVEVSRHSDPEPAPGDLERVAQPLGQRGDLLVGASGLGVFALEQVGRKPSPARPPRAPSRRPPPARARPRAPAPLARRGGSGTAARYPDRSAPAPRFPGRRPPRRAPAPRSRALPQLRTRPPRPRCRRDFRCARARSPGSRSPQASSERECASSASAKRPRAHHHRYSAAQKRSASGGSLPSAHSIAAARLAASGSRSSSHSSWRPVSRWGPACSARARKWSRWRSRTAVFLAGLGKPLEPVLAHGLEQAVAHPGLGALGDHQRLVDQRSEQIEHPLGLDPARRRRPPRRPRGVKPPAKTARRRSSACSGSESSS